jgi:hypothetical protein
MATPTRCGSWKSSKLSYCRSVKPSTFCFQKSKFITFRLLEICFQIKIQRIWKPNCLLHLCVIPLLTATDQPHTGCQKWFSFWVFLSQEIWRWVEKAQHTSKKGNKSRVAQVLLPIILPIVSNAPCAARSTVAFAPTFSTNMKGLPGFSTRTASESDDATCESDNSDIAYTLTCQIQVQPIWTFSYPHVWHCNLHLCYKKNAHKQTVGYVQQS